MDKPTIWQLLEECVSKLSEPFSASEILGWFRRHHPDVAESSIRPHIQGATSNVSVASRGGFATRVPLITRIERGQYCRYAEADIAEDRSAEAPRRSSSRPVAVEKGTPTAEEWHSEVAIQGAVVQHLALAGWTVLSVANTATREHGVDIEASRGVDRVGVEVKGYPSRFYADPRRAGEPKPTQPATQARMWFSQAVYAAMRLRTTQPTWASVIALPDFPTYRRLSEGVAWSLERCEIQIWWVGQDGTVSP